jgi:hypothetical protein
VDGYIASPGYVPGWNALKPSRTGEDFISRIRYCSASLPEHDSLIDYMHKFKCVKNLEKCRRLI